MTNRTAFITGASRGMGVDIAKAALAAGYAVVATGRDPQKVEKAVGAAEDLLTVRLDVTDVVRLGPDLRVTAVPAAPQES